MLTSTDAQLIVRTLRKCGKKPTSHTTEKRLNKIAEPENDRERFMWGLERIIYEQRTDKNAARCVMRYIEQHKDLFCPKEGWDVQEAGAPPQEEQWTLRPAGRAISHTPRPCARKRAISSRSTKDRYRPESGFEEDAS